MGLATQPSLRDADYDLQRRKTIALLPDREPAIAEAWLTNQPQIAVVALATTSAAGPAALRSADIIGAQAVFTTPVLPQSVLRRVDDLLRSRPTPYMADELR